MFAKLTDWLACPKCGADLTLESPAPDGGGDILDGALTCRGCAAAYPVRGGIPRFAGDDSHDFENFGYQWNLLGQVQIDRLAGHRLSEGRLLAETGWDRDWFKGKVVLDCGCGAGRFADVAANLGAEVIAIDISHAVEACRETLALHGERVHCLQASLFELPLKPGVIDAVFSLGVIQHTPDPEKAVAAMTSVVKPGGRLTVNFYEKNIGPWFQPFKYTLRLFTPSWRPEILFGFCKALVGFFFPLSYAIRNIRKVRLLSHVLPICAAHNPDLTKAQQREWTLLDTFDWYGPRYESRQKHTRLAQLLAELDMEDIKSRPGVVQARKPPH